MQHQTHPRRPEPVGFGVHLGFQRRRGLAFHLAEVDTPALPDFSCGQHARSSTAAARTFPGVFHKGGAPMLDFHGFNAVDNAVLQGLKVCRERLKLCWIHGCLFGAKASGYSSGNKCWYFSGTGINVSPSV